MKSRKLIYVTVLAFSSTALFACGGGGGGDTPKKDELESISAITKTSYYLTGDTFDKDELTVFAKYSISGTKTIDKEQYTVKETLPYTFTDDDVLNGKTFNITYSGKSTSVVATVIEDVFKKIDWNTNKVYNNKTLYEIAKESDELIFGKKSDYETEITGFSSFNVDEAEKGYIKGYYSNAKKLYVLSEKDTHKIQFDENDRIKIDSSFYGPFYNLTNIKTITFNKKLLRIAFDDFSYMFAKCNKLTKINGISLIPPFDTSIVKNMSHMFDGCAALTELDLPNFSTDQVTKFDSMFNGCGQLTKIIASKYFRIGSTATSENMFLDCTQLVGGKGTTYDATKVNGTYARIDKGTEEPGYFTAEE